ncbi:YlbL family protein [Corynebacterium kozikiae]|uniref:YlbL family protein n=1 Tax=Corynebacterium kozikiae TaxID=2968469 RepID=UPI00211C92DA|nr:PDZ domain-containing protein [Corynebacterium sp. 76QC2CO]
MNRRLRTLILGFIPVGLLGLLVTVDHIPGTSINLTVPYAAEGPGPTFNTLGEVDGQDVVEIEGAELDPTSGNLNMTTVSVRTGMTLAQALGRWLLTNDTLVPIEEIFPQDMTEEEVQEANQQAFSTSEAAATIAAMNYLNLPVNINVAEVLEDSPAQGVLQPGDTLLRVNGEPVTGAAQVRDTIRALAPGTEITITYQRDGQESEGKVVLGASPDDADRALLGVLMEAAPASGIDVTFHLEDIGGPSAGMMFSLAVIDKLSPGELNGGKFVAGTGTVDDSGEVGPIGGIVHKVDAARQAGAEVFLAPRANCAEAVSREHGDMTIIAVDSIEDAIAELEAYNSGQAVETCS